MLLPTTRATKPAMAHTPSPIPASGLRCSAADFDAVDTERVTLLSKRLLDSLRRAAAEAIVVRKVRWVGVRWDRLGKKVRWLANHTGQGLGKPVDKQSA
jgi:hypothetical protein